MKSLRSVLQEFETLVESEFGVRLWLSDRYLIDLPPGWIFVWKYI